MLQLVLKNTDATDPTKSPEKIKRWRKEKIDLAHHSQIMYCVLK